MTRFNKDYKSKIICAALSALLLFTSAAYPYPSQKESLRVKVGSEDTYQRINETYASPSSHYNHFKRWLKDASQDKLEKTIAFLWVLETLIASFTVTDLDSDLHMANAGALKSMIDSGIVSREEVIKEAKEKNVLEVIFKYIIDSDGDVRMIIVETLKTLIDLGIISKEDAIKKAKEKNVLEIFIAGLTDSDSYSRKANAGALKILIDLGIISKEDAINKVKENNVLETIIEGLIDPDDSYSRKANAGALKILIDLGIVSKEDAIQKVKEKNVLETILDSLADSNSDVLMANAGTLKILIDSGLVSKEEVKENNILETIFKGFTGLYSYSRVAHAEILKALIDSGVVSKEEAIKEAKEYYVLETLLKRLTDTDSDMRRANALALKIMITLDLVSKEEVREKNILGAVLKCLTDPDGDVRKEIAVILKALTYKGLVSKEDVREKNILGAILKGLAGWNSYYVRSANAEALKAMIDAGLVSKEEAKENFILETLIAGLTDTNSDVRRANAWALKALIDSGVVSKEEAIKKIKEKNALEAIFKDFTDAESYYVRKVNAEALKAMVDAGLVSKEEAREKHIFGAVLKRLTDFDLDTRIASVGILKTMINTGLVSEEERLSSEQITSMFKKVYGRPVPASGHIHYYLKFLDILKDDPRAAYQIFNWDIEELHGLFRIFDYFVKGAALDTNYKEAAGKKHSLEKELIKGSRTFFRNPKIFISYLREKIKAIIRDDSVKLEMDEYEQASLNATLGLMNALGLSMDHMIILSDKEISVEQAKIFFKRAFPAYDKEFDIRSLKEYASKDVIDIDFIDYGDMTVKSSGRSIDASLPYTPFKFNLPQKVQEEELNKMKESLGAGSRQVIVVGSPTDTQFNQFMQSYSELYGNLPYTERPLIIVGFRNRRNNDEFKLLASLSGQSIAVRTDDKAPLPDVRSNNVLILNTSGELLRMYALADVAVVGNDRNIFEPASQQTAILYFNGSWENNKDAKDALVEAGATQIFSKERLEELMNSTDKAKKMAADGLEVVKKYREEVLLRAEEFALQIIGADSQLRAKFLVSSPIRIEQITRNIKNSTPLSPKQLAIMDFDSEEALFIWLNSRISENTQLMSELQSSNYPVLRGSGGQSNLEINPQNSDYALKTVVQNFQDMPIASTLDAFKLSQERLGGLVGSFFLPLDFSASHKALVSLAKPLDDQEIRQKGLSFVDEYIGLIESYWTRGVFDHDFKLDGLGLDKQKKLIVIDFGLSEDMFDEGLFVEPAGEEARFWNTFHIGIDKLHNTRDRLNKISPNIGKYFEDQLKLHYQIELLPDWDRDMRGGYEAAELAKKLRIAVKKYRPQNIQKHYVFPLIGKGFDLFINLQIKERLNQNQSTILPQTLQGIFYGIKGLFNSL